MRFLRLTVKRRLGIVACMRVASMLLVALVTAFGAAPPSRAQSEEFSAERFAARQRALAARWDGACPDWAVMRGEYPTWPGVTEFAMAAAFEHLDAEAALCMAAYWSDALSWLPERNNILRRNVLNEQAEYAEVLYYWLAVAAALGADVSEQLDEARQSITPELAYRTRWEIRGRVESAQRRVVERKRRNLNIPRSDLPPTTPSEAEFAQRWDGDCPDWIVLSEVGWIRRVDGIIANATAAALERHDAEAALCAAGYWSGQYANAARHYYWLVIAEELGADINARVRTAEAALSSEEAERQRREALGALEEARERAGSIGGEVD